MPATFYFDLATPYPYLRAERVDGASVADTFGLGAEIEAGIAAPETKAALRTAAEKAGAAGPRGVPAVAVGADLFWGDDRLEEAVATPD